MKNIAKILSIMLLFNALFSQKEYKISKYDVLEILVYPATEFTREVVVQPDGKILHPMFGEFVAEGMTTEELAKNIAEKVKKYVESPRVFVIVKQRMLKSVFIMGEVRSPSSYPYKDKIYLTELIALAGGFTERADITKLKIISAGEEKKVKEINFQKLIEEKEKFKDILLEENDIVFVPKLPEERGWNWFLNNIMPTIGFIGAIIAIISYTKGWLWK
jgi:polysaccharide export outer membrane protein